ncbi:uncharacterized protein LOC141651473 [Silene latifolia]|uniref:uncharacterized protein LOC141651473 n=1 Tax=Silene latifolia TaxID=37657 RepID=UPI003D778DDB
MFVDDLHLFCKGDVKSIFIIMETFKRFSSTSGLTINSEKSDFYCNRMSQHVVQRVLQGIGFKKGELPFKYLGVKISHKRLTKINCNVLVDRMIARIRGWKSRKISYSGRLILVKSVLSTIHNHWSQIFVLPVSIMDRIQALCKTFLWEGSDNYSRSPLVAWNVLCMDNEHGVLGLTDSKIWNYATIGKLVWWVTSKQDHLWIKWVDHIYLKGTPWFQYEPTTYSSWAWRKVCQIKTMFQNGYTNGLWNGDIKEYTISSGYNWLLQNTGSKVPWFKIVWNRYNVPKWNFTMWLVQQKRLLTLDRLRKWGMDVPIECFLCGQAPEDHQHLFQQCRFTQQCLQLLANWLGLSSGLLLKPECHLRLRYLSAYARKVCSDAVVGLYYRIWRCRNVCRLEGYVPTPTLLVLQIQEDCNRQIQGCFKGYMKHTDSDWNRLRNINI